MNKLVGSVPDGYALISIEALKAWGKYDEVRNACQFPAEQAEQEPVAWIAVADEMPKPHKPVLVRYVITSPVYGGTRSKVIRAQWIPAKTEESNDDDHFEYDEETDTYYIPEGWYELVDNWDEYSSIHVCEGEITHWMRLPEFPNAAPVQQAEQEPVAEVHNTDTPSNWSIIKPGLPAGTKLYAAPVRTKDLTDDEIDEIFAEHGTIPNTKAVRSVIAADREKNK